MKVCILGEGLTSLTLAKNLANLGITVDIILNKKNIKSKTRTIGISKSNGKSGAATWSTKYKIIVSNVFAGLGIFRVFFKFR